MRRLTPTFLLSIALLTMGPGCAPKQDYIPAPEQAPIDVEPSAEGGKASTGGQSATITPALETQTLVSAFPVPSENWSAGEPLEILNPIPLPDGTRDEYVSVAREYYLADQNGPFVVKALLSDTRGIPALTAFMESFEERDDEVGSRSRVEVAGSDGWLTYTDGPSGKQDGAGSITFLFRDRFLLQLDGGIGISAEALTDLARSFTWDTLR